MYKDMVRLALSWLSILAIVSISNSVQASLLVVEMKGYVTSGSYSARYLLEDSSLREELPLDGRNFTKEYSVNSLVVTDRLDLAPVDSSYYEISAKATIDLDRIPSNINNSEEFESYSNYELSNTFISFDWFVNGISVAPYETSPSNAQITKTGTPLLEWFASSQTSYGGDEIRMSRRGSVGNLVSDEFYESGWGLRNNLAVFDRAGLLFDKPVISNPKFMPISFVTNDAERRSDWGFRSYVDSNSKYGYGSVDLQAFKYSANELQDNFPSIPINTLRLTALFNIESFTISKVPEPETLVLFGVAMLLMKRRKTHLCN